MGQTLGTGFDSVAEVYDRARPGYPPQLFADILTFAGCRGTPRVLEVGAGTGKATRGLVEAGCPVVAIEPGANMAAVARRNLAGAPVEFIESTFEDVTLAPETFDIVCAATAWHWVDPAVGLRKVHQSLRPGGVMAIFGHVQVRGEVEPDFFVVTQEIYQRLTDLWSDDPGPWRHSVPDRHEAELRASPLFTGVTAVQYDFDQVYDAQAYALLLRSYSNVIALEAGRRERLIAELCALIDSDFGGTITRPLVVRLVMGRRV